MEAYLPYGTQWLFEQLKTRLWIHSSFLKIFGTNIDFHIAYIGHIYPLLLTTEILFGYFGSSPSLHSVTKNLRGSFELKFDLQVL